MPLNMMKFLYEPFAHHKLCFRGKFYRDPMYCIECQLWWVRPQKNRNLLAHIERMIDNVTDVA